MSTPNGYIVGMDNLPARIWLQRDAGREVTWCEDRINDDDVEYVRAPASGEPSVVREAWRPIETAPKDGKNVLIASGSGEVGEARFHGEDGWWWINNDPTDAWGSEVYPTHWMPLPAQPDADTRPDTFDEAAEQARLGYVPVNGAPLPAAPGAPEEGAGE